MWVLVVLVGLDIEGVLLCNPHLLSEIGREEKDGEVFGF